MGNTDAKYKEVGAAALGGPTGGEFDAAGGSGRHFEKGSIFWHPDTGAHVVVGKIQDKYIKLGDVNSKLGFPTTDEEDTGDKGGRKSRFQHGVIAYKWNTDEAFEVRGQIHDKYAGLGGTKSFLGFPTTDETGAPDGKGRFNHFEGGSVYWTEDVGAHEVHGLIRDLWAAGGWERNPNLGYPISDEIRDDSGQVGAWADFENGVAFWRSGRKQASELSKLDLGQSKTRAEMESLIADTIRTHIGKIPVPPDADGIKITGGPRLRTDVAITNYRVGKSRVVNRRYATRTTLEVVFDSILLANIEIVLDIYIEIFFDRAAKAVKFRIDHFSSQVTVSNLTNLATSPKEVNAKIEAAIKAIEPGVVGETAGVNLLSVKTLPNGDLNVYIEPWV